MSHRLRTVRRYQIAADWGILGGTVKRTWPKWLALAVLVGGMGTCGAFVAAEPLAPAPLPVEQVRPAMDRATAPGSAFPVVSEGVVPIREGRARADVTVPAGECVYAVAGAATPYAFEMLALFETATRQALISARKQVVAGLGWCAAGEPLELTLWGTTRALREQDLTEAGEGAMVYRFHVGDPGPRWRPFLVGQPEREELEALVVARQGWAATVRDEREAPSGQPLSRADLGPDAALALPLSAATRWTARALGTLGDEGSPHVPRLQGEGDQRSGTDRPVALLEEGYRRILAVVDPSDLPVVGRVPCVRLHFSRLADEGAWVRRVEVPGLAETPDDEHRLCPGDPLTAFVTAADDPARWRVRVLPDGPPRAERSATAVPEAPLATPSHQRARRACEGGDMSACAEAAAHLRQGRYVARDLALAERFAERACRGEASTCGPYGDTLAERGEEDLAVSAWGRACATEEDGWACVTLGEAHRLGLGTAFDARAALRAYDRACAIGVERGCGRARTMRLLELDAP